MKRRNHFLRSNTRLALFAVAAGAAALPSHAERPLSFSFEERGEYARIVMKWADGDETAPDVSAAIVDQVLVLAFDEQVSANIDALSEALPSWAVISRLDANGKAIRVGLQREGRVHVSQSADLTAVDLLREDIERDPPDIVSPLIARRAREAEAARIAALPPPPPEVDMDIRGSHSGETSRIVLYWPQPVTFRTVSEAPGETKLLFSLRARTDAAYLKVDPPSNLKSFSGENTSKGYAVTIQSNANMPIRTYVADQVVTIDISPEDAPATTEASVRKQLVDEGVMPAKAIPAVDVEPEPLLPAAEKPSPRTPEPASVRLPGDGEGNARGPTRLAPHRAAGTEDAEAANADRDQGTASSATVGGRERVTQLAENWVDPAPPSGVTDVRARPLTNGVELIVDFVDPAAAAVFEMNGDIWAVFAANTDLRVDPSNLPPGVHVRSERTQNATYMRIEKPASLSVSAVAQGPSWTVRLSPTATRPDSFLKTTRRPGEGGRTRIESEVPGAAGIVWLQDPMIGEDIAAIVAYGPTASHPERFETVEVAAPATAHGLVFVPRADSVEVQLEGQRAVATVSNRSQSRVLAQSAPGAPTVPNPAFVDFASWGGLSGPDWYARREELERLVSESDLNTSRGSEALIELAEFYLGHDMALEALGVLGMAYAARPDVELESKYLGIAGAANFMAHRLDEADAYLSKGSLRNDPSASLWRGAIAAERGDWERATDYFRAAGNQPYSYAPEKAAQFASYHAEAAFHTNDFETARREAEIAIDGGTGVAAERGKLVMAMLAAVIEGPQEGYRQYNLLAESAAEPIAVRAELGRLELGVDAGKMSAAEAASELESLRFRWRGDGVEMRTVGILADQYMKVGRFREALLLAKSTALRDANAQGARELRIKLTDYFRQLFLDGQADRLDPIQALGLFYEFSELTPIGADGDQMIRKLAQRLVAFDLLEPAAQLLQHQVDNRMRGVGKAALAVDLATIYLLDKRPDRALAAINSTRQPSIPRELAYERRKLEAAAYRDLERYDHVIELMEPLDQPEARVLLADAYLRKRDWVPAADIYLSILPPAAEAEASDAEFAYKAAIASRMAKSPERLARLRSYSSLFEGRTDAASFDLITAQTDTDGQAISEAVRSLADAPTVDAFSAAMKARFETDPSNGTGGSR